MTMDCIHGVSKKTRLKISPADCINIRVVCHFDAPSAKTSERTVLSVYILPRRPLRFLYRFRDFLSRVTSLRLYVVVACPSSHSHCLRASCETGVYSVLVGSRFWKSLWNRSPREFDLSRVAVVATKTRRRCIGQLKRVCVDEDWKDATLYAVQTAASQREQLLWYTLSFKWEPFNYQMLAKIEKNLCK